MARTRPAQPSDQPFLFQVYASTRQAEMAAWGWEPAQQETFLWMQFQHRTQAYRMQFPKAEYHLILDAERPIGTMILAHEQGALRLVDIALLPEARGTGIGSELMRALQAEAARTGRALHLHVNKGNPARRLYDRLGFTVTRETDIAYAMVWRP